jgi:spore maturation protein CgeB
MKILIAGNNKTWSIERYFRKYLEMLGAEVIFFPSGDIVYDFHTKNVVNKLLFHSKLVTKYPYVNRELLNVSRTTRPDVIWVFKGMEIYPDTLEKLKQEGFRLANFNPDHPFIIPNKGSGNRNVSDSVPLYDLHFCYQRKLQQEIEQGFGVRTAFLPFAYDHEDVQYIDPASIDEINKLCFQANPDPYRVQVIEKLAEEGIAVDVYGHGWDKTSIASKKGVSVHPIASRAEFWKKNQQYRVQLNLFREYNYGSHNMRTFEIPVVGGVQLTVYSDEQAEFFEAGKEIFFFNDPADLVVKAKEILSMPAENIRAIRQQARDRSLNSGYSFKDRAQTVFETFRQL